MALDGPYSSELLALAADIPHLGELAAPHGRARKRSMVCGSEVEVALRLDGDDRIEALGMDVQACALGQAAASVFARSAIGAGFDEVTEAADGFEAMLKQGGPVPQGRFAGLAALEVVRDYPRRHASALLAFKAAREAFAQALDARAADGPAAP